MNSKKTLALEIVRTLRRNGHQAYFVGGCVRDLLLKKAPKDFDVATDAVPERVAALFPKTVPVGAQFGVMLVVCHGVPFEVATFRADKGYQDGRRPTGVRFTDAREDAIRRDFTVNGLFYDPLARGPRRVLDWVGGEKDLKKKVIRAIGDPVRRFTEDKLRLLRAVRFASVLGFRIEPKTLAAIRKLAPKITEVSSERVRDELVKMFTGPSPALALDLLDRSGLLVRVLPEVSKMKGVKQPRAFHPEGDVFVHTRLLLKGLENAPADLAFGCLLHDIGKPPTYRRSDRIRFNGHDRVGARMTERILERLRFPNDLKDRIVACVEGHMRFKDVKQMRESTLKRFMRRDTFETELAQHRLDCLASHGDLSNWHFLRKKMRSFTREDIRPKPLLSGHDLLALGYAEGPLIGRMLRAVEELQLDSRLSTREEAVQWLRENAESLARDEKKGA
ncbi:MAG TPA: CCA tRNA nucleotidyltransferase [Candidatus Eisenbacteria bacterium]|nr:CCA tRNA nucleotidyltransferase [Candidatus Eisenbacteria bacterium]